VSGVAKIFGMALYYELPVYKACYDLLLEVFRFTKGFSKEYKRANSRKDKSAVLEEARILSGLAIP
jgi:hypothetical protein